MGLYRNTRTVTADDNIESYDQIIYADTTSNTVALTLPHISTGNIIPGHKVKIIDSAGTYATNNLTINTSSGDGSTIYNSSTSFTATIDNLIIEVELLENNTWTIINKGNVLRDKISFTESAQTNSLAASYALNVGNHNFVNFTADSNVTLSYSGATKGTYAFLINTAGFTVDLATGSVWQTSGGTQPTITGKTLLTALFDGSKMIVVELSDILDIT